MKNKIKTALQQGHTDLGITDEEVFERVATVAETFIKDEAQIPEFVAKAGDMLKLYQSQADKARTAKKRVSELEAQLEGMQKPGDDKPKDVPLQNDEAIRKLIADTVAATNEANAKVVEDLRAQLDEIKSSSAAKEAVISAKANYNNNDWVKGYPDEAEEAWERAIEINTERGGKMTADELVEKAMGYFGRAVSKRGGDISKPYESQGGSKAKFDADEFRKSLERTGRVKPKEQ